MLPAAGDQLSAAIGTLGIHSFPRLPSLSSQSLLDASGLRGSPTGLPAPLVQGRVPLLFNSLMTSLPFRMSQPGPVSLSMQEAEAGSSLNQGSVVVLSQGLQQQQQQQSLQDDSGNCQQAQ